MPCQPPRDGPSIVCPLSPGGLATPQKVGQAGLALGETVLAVLNHLMPSMGLSRPSRGICSIIFPGSAEAEELVHMASWGDGGTCRVLQHSLQGSILPVVSCSRLKIVAALGDGAVGLNNSTGSESKPVSPWRMAPGLQAMGMLLRSSCLTLEYSQRISLGSALRRMWLSWDMWLPGDAPAVVAVMDISSTVGLGPPLTLCVGASRVPRDVGHSSMLLW